MLPTHQRLEADDLAADLGLRLVMQDELAARDCRAQLLLDRAPLPQALVHAGLEKADRAAALGLGAIERGVGIADERPGIGPVGRKNRDADAEPDPQQRAVDVEIVGDGREQAVGQRRGARRLRPIGLDQQELVAAEAGEEGVTGGIFQAAGNCAQQLVADDMAENVVDLLEAIEIEAEDGEALARAARLVERQLQALVERRPVRQVGQGVVMRHMGDPLLRLLALGDVLEHAQNVPPLSILAGDGEPLGHDHARAVVAGFHRKILDQVLLTRFQRHLVAPGNGVGVLLAVHIVEGLADQFVAGETEEFLPAAIDELVAVVEGILDNQRRRHVLDDSIEKRLGAMQFAFGPQLLGHVLVGRDPAATFDRRILDRNGASVGQRHRAGFDLAALDELGEKPIRVAVERAGRDPPLQQLAHAAAGVQQVRGNPVHLEVTAIVEQQPALRVEHQQAGTHVVERLDYAPARGARPIEQAANRHTREQAQDARQDDRCPIMLGRKAGENAVH